MVARCQWLLAALLLVVLVRPLLPVLVLLAQVVADQWPPEQLRPAQWVPGRTQRPLVLASPAPTW